MNEVDKQNERKHESDFHSGQNSDAGVEQDSRTPSFITPSAAASSVITSSSISPSAQVNYQDLPRRHVTNRDGEETGFTLETVRMRRIWPSQDQVLVVKMPIW